MSQELTKRNNEIFFERKQGSSIQALADKYQLSRARIYQIIDHVRYENNHPNVNIPEIYEACRLVDAYPCIYQRIINVLKKANLHKRNVWKTASREELCNIDGLGSNLIDIILMAQTIENRR